MANKRFNQITRVITSFDSNDVLPIGNGTLGDGKMSKDTLLQLTSQNALAGNVAPEFVPNSTTTVAGLPYMYNGSLYMAKVSGYQGPWDASKFKQISLMDYFASVHTVGSIASYEGTISSSNYDLVTRKTGYAQGSIIYLSVATSAHVNVVAKTVNSGNVVIKELGAGTHTLEWIATDEVVSFGFYLFSAASTNVKLSVRDNIMAKTRLLEDSVNGLEEDVGFIKTYSGSQTSGSHYTLINVKGMNGKTVHIEFDTSYPCNVTYFKSSSSVIANTVPSYSADYTIDGDNVYFGVYIGGTGITASINMSITYGLYAPDAAVGRRIRYTPNFANKSLLILGDSISTGSYYYKYLRSLFRHNNTIAVSGATWCDRSDTSSYDGNPSSSTPSKNVIGNQVKKITNNPSVYSPDIIIVSAGTNDDVPESAELDESLFTSGSSWVEMTTPTFDASDTYAAARKTFTGAFRWSVTQLQKTYPNSKIFILSPIQAAQGIRTYAGTKKKGQLLKALADRMSVNFIDVGGNCGIYGDFEYLGTQWTEVEPASLAGRYLKDGLHPNDAGSRAIAKVIIKGLYNAYTDHQFI